MTDLLERLAQKLDERATVIGKGGPPFFPAALALMDAAWCIRSVLNEADPPLAPDHTAG